MQHFRCFCFILCILLSSVTVGAADTDASFQDTIVFEIGSRTALVNGEPKAMDTPVMIHDDRSTIPLKYLADWFGGTASWDGTTRCATLTFDDCNICAFIDQSALSVDGNPFQAQPAPFLYHDRTYLSIRTVADILGKHLYYNGNDKPVVLSDKEIASADLGTLIHSAQTALQPFHLLQWPVPDYYKISTIANCDNPDCYSHYGGKNGHGALDIPAPAGTAVVAAADGVVAFAGFGDSTNCYTGYGNIVLIDHGNGISTHYSHLTDITVAVGDTITCGAQVGTVGHTGYATGNHLDFAVWQDGKKIDPLPLLEIPAQATCYEPCDQPFLDAARQK